MSFKFLEHTADVLFLAEGKTFEEALEEASKALSRTISDKVKKTKEFEFEESAQNIEELTIASLSRLLVESEVLGLLPGGLRVTSFSEKPGNFRAKIMAWAGEGRQKTIVKGVTYGMLKVERTKNKCTMQVLLDI
ncbi:MAG: archease [Candidatus Berkelbacteria bacterium]|nr:archease [Candidatus Berkelbacteria bacterium]